jgi:CRP/FNR family transcriptional regulator
MSTAAQNVIALKSSNRPERAGACLACTKRGQCPAAGIDASVQPVQSLIRAGETLYEAGDAFDGVYIVRSGFLKSYAIDPDGVMQVTGFHLPGDFVGLEGIEHGAYGEHVEALDTTSVCKLTLSVFKAQGAAEHEPAASSALMLMLVNVMSRTIASDRRMFFTLGKMTARRRMGMFLKELSERMARSGYSASEFTLCMSRTDIANYLCLALETVSRLITQLHAEGIIEIDRRHIRLLDMDALVRDEFQEKARKAG